MRSSPRVFGAFALASLIAAPVGAQQRERTVDDYICEFSGDCGGAPNPASQPTADAGETKGFAIARAAAPKPKTPAIATPPRPVAAAATRAPVSRRNAAAAAPAGRVAAAVKAPAPVAAAAVTATAERRADLRLGFALGSDQLDEPSKARARVFAQALKTDALAGKKFMIEGHTDSIGGRAFNLDLSSRRAKAVADFLIGEGVSADRLQMRGYGFDRPMTGMKASNPENRRVEAVVVS